jgi:hypothetical protein
MATSARPCDSPAVEIKSRGGAYCGTHHVNGGGRPGPRSNDAAPARRGPRAVDDLSRRHGRQRCRLATLRAVRKIDDGWPALGWKELVLTGVAWTTSSASSTFGGHSPFRANTRTSAPRASSSAIHLQRHRSDDSRVAGRPPRAPRCPCWTGTRPVCQRSGAVRGLRPRRRAVPPPACAESSRWRRGSRGRSALAPRPPAARAGRRAGRTPRPARVPRMRRSASAARANPPWGHAEAHEACRAGDHRSAAAVAVLAGLGEELGLTGREEVMHPVRLPHE